jgi:hypothetical protein
MLNALIKAKNNLTNIRDIIRVEQGVGEQFHSAGTQANPSVAKTTLHQYGDDTTRVSRDCEDSGRNKCFGCGGPHPWSKMVDGNYFVVCPNTNKPGIHKKAKLNIQKYQQRCRRNSRNNKKQWNLNTVNCGNIPAKRQAVLLDQHHVPMGVTTSGGGGTSIVSSIIGPTNTGIICRVSVTLHQDVVVLSTHQCSNKPQITIAIKWADPRRRRIALLYNACLIPEHH